MKRFLSAIMALVLCLPLMLCALPAIYAADVTPPVITGVSMSISADFGVHFHISAPKGVQEVGAVINEREYRGVLQEDGSYTVSFRHLTPKQMTELIVAEPYYLKNTHLIRGTAYSFSVCDYATALLESDPSPELRTLLVTMLNYGTKAQQHFGHNLKTLANRNLPAADRQYEAREYESILAKLSGLPTQDRGEVTGATLLVQNRVRFKIFVDVVGQEELRYNQGAPADEVVDGMTPEQEAQALVEGMFVEVSHDEHFEKSYLYPLVKCSENDGYRALTDGLYATEFSDAFYFRVVTADGVGTAIQYSVETYAARQSSKTSTSARLMAAMILFGDAAKAYEASLSSENEDASAN